MAKLVAQQKKLWLFGITICILLAVAMESVAQDTSKYDPLSKKRAGMDTAFRRWKSWNILFKPGTSPQNVSSDLLRVEQYVLDYLHSIDPSYTAFFDIFYCPCDSALFNIGATALDGTGNAVIPPSGGPNPPIPSGDMLQISVNNTISEEPRQRAYPIDSLHKFDIKPPAMQSDKVLAIMDTGIDSTLFVGQFSNVIWRPDGGRLALFNYIESDPRQWANYFDNHRDKHGTGVAALAFTALESGSYPRVMVLKVLDSRKTGSTFTLSCALSYAIQNNASVVNASLGYYERTNKVDLILREYLRKCNAQNIYVFAAAGNRPEPHNLDLCKRGTATNNELRPGRLFYPACFSTSLGNIITVTGITDLKGSCFYQNCSKKYVTVGVLNTPACCKYGLPFMNAGYEGSSFSTPVAVGMTMRKFLDGTGDIKTSFNSIIQTANSLKSGVKKGTYIKYTLNPNF